MPAIAASGGTVIAAMLVLLVADLESTHWLGPILAIGIAVMLAAAFTLLPALLSLLGERAFWPARGATARFRTHASWRRNHGAGARVADLVRRRSRTIVVGVFAVLVVLALGNLVHHGTIGFGQGETRPTESSRGTEVLDEHFPPGLGSPLTAVVEADEVGRGRRGAEAARHSVKLAAAGAADRRLRRGGGRRSSCAATPTRARRPTRSRAIRERLHEVAPGGLRRRHPGRELRRRADQRPRHAS